MLLGSTTAPAFGSSPIFSLTKPFTRRTLQLVRDCLSPHELTHKSAMGRTRRRHAAVLIPFCNVGGVPGILLQVRAKTMRSHSGEVSFPGGKMEDTDGGLVGTAIRETEEELGISEDRIEVLGEIGPTEVNGGGSMSVWPFVGFIHQNEEWDIGEKDDPLPSLDLASIRKAVSTMEVAAIFHLPLEVMTTPTRLRAYLFRGQRPYWAVEASDLVRDDGADIALTSKSTEPSADRPAEFEDFEGLPKEKRLEIWGLSGWYLSVLMKTLQVYR